MASPLVQPDPQSRRLSIDEGWDLILRSYGSAKDVFAEYGGGKAWLRSERESWGEEQAG
jgi:hypothetical protein